MSRCGYDVLAYEPDPTHFDKLTANLSSNSCENVTHVNAAVSNRRGNMDFVRVLGNTTSSHLLGSKSNPYGEIERFPVPVEEFVALIRSVDLVKIDAEGHEKDILLSTNSADWSKTDAIVEVSSKESAEQVLEHFNKIHVGMFSQKINWQRVSNIRDMPHSYRDGSLFIKAPNSEYWVSPK